MLYLSDGRAGVCLCVWEGGGGGCTNFNERVGPPLIKEPNYG